MKRSLRNLGSPKKSAALQGHSHFSFDFFFIGPKKIWDEILDVEQ